MKGTHVRIVVRIPIAQDVVELPRISRQDADRDAAVWLFRGNRLKQVPEQVELGGDGGQQINDVTSYREGFIAVGEETKEGDTDAVVWVSRDGRIWERLNDPDVFGGRGDERMYAVASSDSVL